MIVLTAITCSKNLKLYEIATSSMEPSLKLGSAVIAIKINKMSGLKTGDIIVYKTPQIPNLITHRIINIYSFHNKNLFITKGDNNTFEDPYPIIESEIIGKVILVIPYLGLITRTISSYKFLSISFYAPLGFLLGRAIKRFL